MSFFEGLDYDQSWQHAEPGGVAGGRAQGPVQGPSGDMNPDGAAYDPFGYTKGSLLTPWEGHFDGSKYGGGGSGVAEFKPFGYGDFNYSAAVPGGFDERYDNPGDFKYGDYEGKAPFRETTAKDLARDPGAKFREDRAMKVLQASKAAQGVLKTGGTLKAMQSNASDLASQEFGAVDARRRRDYDSADAASRFKYGTNRSNAAENFDRNVSNARTGYQVRQGAWKDNAAVALEGSRFGYDVAQGTWDRNFAKARQGWQDAADHDQAVASAGAAGAARDYARGLDEYKMARDEFWTNQDRQYSMLDHEDMKGRDAAFGYADRVANVAGARAENQLGRGNAQASGVVGAGNAYAGAYGNFGQNVADFSLYAATRPRTATAPRTVGRVAPANVYSGVPRDPRGQAYG